MQLEVFYYAIKEVHQKFTFTHVEHLQKRLQLAVAMAYSEGKRTAV